MLTTKYLVVGSSHAALEAVNAIRRHDPEGSLTLATRDRHRPYSPTVLPYVVSGKSAPDRVFLRDELFFAEHRVDYRPGAALADLDASGKVARFAGGESIGFEKVLLATGASPVRPPIPGLEEVKCHVLRTLDDATALQAAAGSAQQAVVLGGGLVGMHAAENLIKAGVPVTIVEMNPQVLGGYFDADAAALIERAFTEHGARLLTGQRVVGLAPAQGNDHRKSQRDEGPPRVSLTPSGGGRGKAAAWGHSSRGATVKLSGGDTLDADLLLLAAGVRPEIGYLNGSGIECGAGILVDDAMRTSATDVWAAGDCAQARDFFSAGKRLNAILPTAAEQGRIAGMAMAGDSGLKPYAGGVPLNTYRFFGRHAISVGSSEAPEGAEVMRRVDATNGRYLKAIFEDGRLRGIFGINEFFDGGVMWQLILRRIDLSAVRERLFADPLGVGRELMSKHWR